MNRGRNRSAWIWVALAALTLASVAQSDGRQSARISANPVLQFFGASHSAQPAALHANARAAQYRSGRQLRTDRRTALAGAWLSMLPVFFIGLVSPLNQVSASFIHRLDGMPSAPLLPACFKRPPPFQFA